MLFIAIAMILIGILCFIYVSLAQGDSNKAQVDRLESNFPGKRRAKMQETDLRHSLYNARGRSQSNDLDDDRILHERSFSDSNYSDPEVLYTKPVMETSKRPDIVDSVSVIDEAGSKVNLEPESHFKIRGLLFMDMKGKIPYEKKDLKDLDLSEDCFQDLRRVGEGAMSDENGSMIFRVKNLTYTYEPRDLKQVVFFDEAVVFLPSRPDLPAPVFFTDGTDEVRAFFAQAEKAL
ncbi:LIC_11490 family protein [Leptospira sp. GIMC2001]|uniref:LIC_11490 family protein n=1 Tax=Leptospira sp. GIMC2001 TaxID=1513297 RepID=UPI00234A448F|nr:hypothetical protein [Leptospira sp. GIMC2001]WCL50313.1 hypothetical protein O4O04_05700 [Leptospira sp. GIMC2001]